MAPNRSGILSVCFLTFTFICCLFQGVAAFSSSDIEKFVDILNLPANFDPIIAAYWDGLPHHRRTPFAVSPDGKCAYLAFLDSSLGNVYVQQVDPSKFTAVGSAVKIGGAKEAGGLVAHNDGFAVLVTVPPEGKADVPPNNYPIAAIYRYKNGVLQWKRPINGPGLGGSFGLVASPDMNGDLVYSEKAGLYSAYIVVTAYSGEAKGHFGDAITYVNDSGEIQNISGSSSWGCSHNTGIALEPADSPPFASVCAEDHGSIWLNTGGLGMGGPKIANENTTNGVSGEPMGGMSGSYSNLARFPGTPQYIFAWQSRGAVQLKPDDWMGNGYTQCDPRWLNHNVAISMLKDKSTLAGPQAISTVGAASGDAQVDWVTKSASEDHQNVHVATFDSKNALVTWELLNNPDCQPVPLSCTGTFGGTYFQQVDIDGKLVGSSCKADDVYVSGDIVNIGNQRLCWPYVNMKWDLSAPKSSGTPVSKMSFACLSLGNGSAGTPGQPQTTTTTSTSTTTTTSTSNSPKTSTSNSPKTSVSNSPKTYTSTSNPKPKTTSTSITVKSNYTSTSVTPTYIPPQTITSKTSSVVKTTKSPKHKTKSTKAAAPTPTSETEFVWCKSDYDCPYGMKCIISWGSYGFCMTV